MINSVFDFAIGIITCFLDSSLVIILTLGFFFPSLLFFAFIILPTLSTDKAENTSLIHKTSSMFGEIFILEICAYDFLTFEDFVSFLVTVLMFLVEGSIAEVVVGGGITTEDRVGVNTSRVVFSFRFAVVEVKDFSLVSPLGTAAMKHKTYLLMVSFFSLSKMRTSHFKT